MPPKKESIHQITLQKLDTLQETTNKNSEAVNMIQLSLTTFELLLESNLELTRCLQQQIDNLNNQSIQEPSPVVRDNNVSIPLVPIPVFTDAVGRVHKKKILKSNILEAIDILSPDGADIYNLYKSIGSCAFFRIKMLIEVIFNKKPPAWCELLPRYRQELIQVLNERVLEIDIDLSRCEENWISNFLLKRSYQNKEKYLLSSSRYTCTLSILENI